MNDAETIARLRGECDVLARLLLQAVDVLRTIEPESTDEGQHLAGLIDASTQALLLRDQAIAHQLPGFLGKRKTAARAARKEKK